MDHPEPKGRKVVFMLTLKELKKIVKVADVEKRIPSVKSLKEHKVVVKEMINADTTISVYDHGYVLYTAGNQSTVFPLHSCDDYEYVSVTGDNKEFNKEFFDNENWYIRLLMEAEDRMAYSQSKISTNHGVFSNSDVTDDAEIMRGSSKDFVDDVIDREILNALIKELTERQKTVLNLVYFEEMRQQDVADYLGIKQQSVNDLLNRALKTMKKKAENEEFKKN
ncbi:sigma-70 family RNA polymerase sigma factor [Dorea longicatena]